jgi:hypothetical protein
VAIVVSYVHPTMQSISETQEDTITYELERQKVNAVNAQLAELMSKMDSVSAADQRKHDMYLPEQLDDVNVVRDLYLMAQEAQVWFRDASVSGEVRKRGRSSNLPDNDEYPVPFSFTLTVEGGYQQIKDLLALVEQNKYPLEIHNLSITGGDGLLLTADIELVTFTYRPEDSAI